MKPFHFIPPVVALVSIGAWIATQRQSIASLEKEAASLREHIAAARSADGSHPSPDTPSLREKPKSAKETFDWKKLAAWVDDMHSGRGMGDLRAMMRFQQQVQEMSKDDILAALREIAALDLPEKSREQLEFMFLGPLIEKDPEYALKAYIERLGTSDRGLEYQLSTALGNWAKKDLAAATAWFDGRLGEGKFESRALDDRNSARVRFEAALLGPLIDSDPVSAERRIAAYPENQKQELLRQMEVHEMKPAARKAYAEMVRGQLSSEDAPRVIANSASKLAYQGDYGKISEFLSEIDAASAERAGAVEEAGQARLQMLSHNKKIGREDVDAMREWAATQSPGTVDAATGKILGNFATHGNGFEFSDAAAMALQYHEEGAGDDVLVSLLESHVARANQELALQLAEKITDPIRRAEALLKVNEKR